MADRPAAQRQSGQLAPVPRLALSKAEAAESLSVSVEFFERHVMSELRVVRRGRRWLIPTAELQRWVDETAERVIER